MRIEGVSIKHRFGGHGGISTEWELTADFPHHIEFLRQLPTIFLIQPHIGTYACSLMLPEGVPWDLAGKVAGAWAHGWASRPMDIERITRLLTRCQVWGIAFTKRRPIREATQNRRYTEALAAEYGT